MQRQRQRQVRRLADLTRARKLRPRDADDRTGDFVNVDRSANNRGIAAEATKPVAMTENGHRSSVRLVIGVAARASNRCIHAQSVVISAGNELPGGDLRLLARQRVQLLDRLKSE